jgi:hypothetical protein
MPIGICKLCLLTKDLKDSHLTPRSLYKRSRGSDKKGSQDSYLQSCFFAPSTGFPVCIFSRGKDIFGGTYRFFGRFVREEKRFRATIMSCHSGLEPQAANKNFRNSFFAIANQFALDQLLESANHLRGVPA